MTEAAEVVFGEHLETAKLYVDILASDGIEWGLIGPREADRLWERHVLNAVAVQELVPEGAEVVDVGSGAGLPGLPLAIARPDLRVTLLEPLLRRVNFLERTVAALGLGERVEVVRGRAEEFDGAYDVVTSRALAPLARLLDWCLPLTGSRGEVIAIKGRSAVDEVASARRLLSDAGWRAEVLTVRAHRTSEPTTAVRLRRT